MLDKLLHHAVRGVPHVLRLPLKTLPFDLYRDPMSQALQHVFKEQLADGELDFLDGRWLEVEVTDLAWKFCVSVEDDRILLSRPGREADVQFRGNGDDLLLIAARQQDPDTLFFQRKLKVSGDTELGLAIKNLMAAMEWDQLPKPLGWAMHSAANVITRARAAGPTPLAESSAPQFQPALRDRA